MTSSGGVATVVTHDGETARVEVGHVFTYPAGSQDAAELKEVILGVTGHVRPRYSADGRTLKLDVLAEVRELEGFQPDAAGRDQPVIAPRRLGSSIDLADGDTIVFGGLVTRHEQAVEDKIPSLGDIPPVRSAFRKKGIHAFARELIVMVTVNRAGEPDPPGP